MFETATFNVQTQKPIYHSVNEWFYHNKKQYKIFQDGGIRAEKVIEKSDRIRDSTKEAIEKKKLETERELNKRIHDIDFVRGELEKVRKRLQDELEVLELLQKRIEDEWVYIAKNAKEIIEKCLQLRKERRGIDKVHDYVETELEKESKKLKEAETLLQKALEQTKETRRNLRASLYLLNKDVEGKLDCLGIELECLHLKETDLGIDVYRGSEVLDNANITVKEWARYSEEVIKSAEEKIREARLLQPHFQNILKEIFSDMKNQFSAVNDAFQMRILEIKEAKARLENEHYEVTRQVNNMSLNIAELEKSIQEKQGYLALAQTRLEKRSHRPGRELVRDEVEASLVKEVLEINQSVSQLQQMLYEAETALRCLLKTQVRLEEEINIKTNSIKIDEVDCLTLRQGINYQPF